MRYYRYSHITDSDNFADIQVSNLPDSTDVGRVQWEDWPRASSWSPLAITEIYDVEDGRKQEFGDFPGLMNFCRVPVFSARAWEILSRRIDCRWEALPLVRPDGLQLYLIHVMETIDCVDLDRSEVTRYSPGRVMQIERFCLKPEKLEEKHIFKTPEGSGLDLLVDDVFREIVQQHGLRGLEFRRGLIPIVGSADDAETFGDASEARYTQLAGRPIRTVNDLAAALKDGAIQPGQVPVNYVVLDGRKVMLKALNWAALVRAGVSESDWMHLDQTGKPVPGMCGTTFVDMARIQAQRENVPNEAGKRRKGPTTRR
jgi:hypothetical protein